MQVCKNDIFHYKSSLSLMPKYKNNEQFSPETLLAVQQLFSDLIQHVGEDINRPGLLKTPERAAKAIQYLTHGYDLNPSAILRSAMFEEEYSEMVIVKDIE